MAAFFRATQPLLTRWQGAGSSAASLTSRASGVPAAAAGPADRRISGKCGLIFEGLLSGLAVLHVRPPADWMRAFFGGWRSRGLCLGRVQLGVLCAASAPGLWVAQCVYSTWALCNALTQKGSILWHGVLVRALESCVHPDEMCVKFKVHVCHRREHILAALQQPGQAKEHNQRVGGAHPAPYRCLSRACFNPLLALAVFAARAHMDAAQRPGVPVSLTAVSLN